MTTMEITTDEYIKLMKLAYEDELTGLGNRAAMKEKWSRDEGEIMDILLIDLNKFKRVNDTLGHEAGDKVLQRFANFLSTGFRGLAVSYRLGGDEFAVFVMADVYSIIEAIELWEDPATLVTASVGSAAAHAGFCGEDLRVNLKNADTAMYEAKMARGTADRRSNR